MGEFNTHQLLTSPLTLQIPVNNDGAWGRIASEDLSGIVSGVYGDIVVFNPDQLGPYTTGQDAIADVPLGGTLKIIGDWDTSVQGKINLTTSMTIEGCGWSREWTSGPSLNRNGTRIINTADDNAISVDAPDVDGTERIDGFQIRNLLIEHTGASTPGVRISDVVYFGMNNVCISCKSAGHTGLRLLGGSFFNQIHNCLIRDFTDYGVKHEGNGGSNILQNCHIKSDHADVVAAVYSETELTTFGGQINSKNGDGIQLRASGTNIEGGLVLGTWFEKGQNAISVDNVSTGTWKGLVVSDVIVTLDSGNADRVQRFVSLDNCEDCHIIRPRGTFNAGALVDFGADADSSSLEIFADHMATNGITVTAGVTPTRCYVRIPESTDTQINTATSGIDASISDDVRVEVGFNSTVGAPVFREAGAWYSQDVTGYTP